MMVLRFNVLSRALVHGDGTLANAASAVSAVGADMSRHAHAEGGQARRDIISSSAARGGEKFEFENCE